MAAYRRYHAPGPPPRRASGRVRLRHALIAASIALVLAATAACAILAFAPAAPSASLYDESASTLRATPSETAEAVQARLNRTAEQSSLWISVAQAVRADADSPVLYATEHVDAVGVPATMSVLDNSAENTLDMRYTITLAETGETLYESDLIAPGQSIDRPVMNRVLEPGIYRAVATGRGFDPATHKACGGGVAATIAITVSPVEGA